MSVDYSKMCGKHSAIYEAYYNQIDAKGTGVIEAMTAAKFLKKSGLSDVVLSRVWDLSDPNGKGFLDKPGFYIALKLVSLAQAGQVYNMANIYIDTPNPPKVGDLPKIIPPRIKTVPVSSGGVANGDWSISVIDRLKYEQLFESLKPVGGMLPGNKVKGVLMDSKLPMDTLGKIWDLADQDKDGNLDKHEFIVAMHLVYQTLDKRTVPNMLPPELRKAAAGGGAHAPTKPPPMTGATVPRAPSCEGFGDGGFVANFPKDIAPPPAVPVIPAAIPPMTRVPPVGGILPQPLISTDPLIPIGAPPSVTANAEWVVTGKDLQRYEIIFRDSDRDKDGLVSGLEVKNVFLQSGVPQQCLAHIWALCDSNQSGKLALEQFALAMWMVERKQQGIEPPQALTSSMIPPSLRGSVTGIDVQPQAEPKPVYTNPELEMISKEIEELAKERRTLETEISQREADIRIKSGEVRSLQSELDTLSATLKQLENQRGEAQKRLDDLKAQVNKIREQCQKQEDTINEQEGELNTKRSELQKLKDEEVALQKEYDENNRELQRLTQHLQNTQLQISSVRSIVTELMETQRQMTDALLMCRAAIENQDGELVSEYQLKIEPDFDDARKTLEKKIEIPKADPFEDNINSNSTDINKTTTNNNGFTTNGFANDPFAGATINTNITNIRSGFDDSFNISSGFDSGFDAFGNSSTFGQQKDPFGSDAFGGIKSNAITPEPGKDDFGSDPFAALHAPTGQGQVLRSNTQRTGDAPPRPESPSPALPPKKSKVPPPRPAPPRPVQGPARTTQSTTDTFGATSSSGGFADFADFDNKVPAISNLSPLSFIPLTTQTDTIATTNLRKSSTSSTSSSLSTLTSQTTTTNNIPTASAALSLLDATSFFNDITTKNAINLISSSANTLTTTSSSFINSSTTTITNSSISTNNNNDTNLTQNNATITTTMTTTTTPISSSLLFGNLLGSSTTSSLQQATDDIFSTTTTKTSTKTTTTPINQLVANNTGSSSNHSHKIPTIVSGPTDFSDDPFKDYRYEDPFDIVDPFEEDNFNSDPEKLFKDDFSSDAESKITSTTNTIGNNNFLEKFDAFNLNSSPTNDNISINNERKSPQSAARATPFGNFDDFDAFSVKSDSIKSATTTKQPNNNTNNSSNKNYNKDTFFDAFNDTFDTNANAMEKTNSNSNVFDAFGDLNNVDAAFGVTTTTTNTRNDIDGSAASVAFDAFSVPPTIGKTNATNADAEKLFNAFNDNTFEDDFFGLDKTNSKSTAAAANTNNESIQKDKNFHHFNNGKNNVNNNLTSITATTTSVDTNFAKFDDFDSQDAFATDFKTALNNSINMTNTTKHETTKLQKNKNLSNKINKLTDQTDNSSSGNVMSSSAVTKLPQKFAADYSKPETFDDDLQEAIKRSMFDN